MEYHAGCLEKWIQRGKDDSDKIVEETIGELKGKYPKKSEQRNKKIEVSVDNLPIFRMLLYGLIWNETRSEKPDDETRPVRQDSDLKVIDYLALTEFPAPDNMPKLGHRFCDLLKASVNNQNSNSHSEKTKHKNNLLQYSITNRFELEVARTKLFLIYICGAAWEGGARGKYLDQLSDHWNKTLNISPMIIHHLMLCKVKNGRTARNNSEPKLADRLVCPCTASVEGIW